MVTSIIIFLDYFSIIPDVPMITYTALIIGFLIRKLIVDWIYAK